MHFTVDVFHHFDSPERDGTKFDQILARLERLMTAADDMQAKLDEINTATNDLAADIQKLKDLISTSMSAADVAAVQARLDTTAAALTALAAQQ